MTKKYTILDKINTPYDLKKVPENQLITLCNEIREFLIDTLNISGGHFASSLGALELTVALHYIFDTPKDNIVWDVGHQTYIHKILTGRKDKLITIKKDGGISGFPKRSESQYDSFGVGHSSTSISAALGMASANRIKKDNSESIAVIGDGAITGGMAFEALNHAGGINENLLVVLNDNEMSISDNVGGLTNHFSKIISGKFYNSVREKGKEVFKNVPPVLDFLKRLETQTKGMFVPANIFEDFGLYYIGPIDGHDINELIRTLKILKNHEGPKILHILTKKGKGYQKAENDPISFHHVAPKFNDNIEEKAIQKIVKKQTYSNIFGNWLCKKASEDKKLVGITPAMKEGSDLIEFSKKYPNRYFDVAIAEQHAVTFAGGLACEGLKPVVAIYSTFLQRAYDQVIHDISLQNLDVLYAVDRAGLVGADGATHNGSFDISFMRCIPNNVVMTPSDENECYHMLELGYNYNGPAMVRYPRGSVTGIGVSENLDIKLGKANLLKDGKDYAILNFGTLLPIATKLSKELNATLIDMRFVKPIDEVLLEKIAKSHNHMITIEENAIQGGAGSAVNEFLISKGLHKNIDIFNFGLEDIFLDHGTKELLLDDNNLSFEKIFKKIKKSLA